MGVEVLFVQGGEGTRSDLGTPLTFGADKSSGRDPSPARARPSLSQPIPPTTAHGERAAVQLTKLHHHHHDGRVAGTEPSEAIGR